LNETDFYNGRWSTRTDMKKFGPTSRWLRTLIRHCFYQIEQGKIHSILDVGCGEGSNTFEIAKLFPMARVIGYDISGTAIAKARAIWQEPNLNFSCVANGELLKEMYDCITCFEVLEHLENWQSFLKNIIKQSSQYVCVSFPTGRMRDFETNVGHKRNFSRGEVEIFMKRNGFEPVEILYAGFPFYSPLYRNLCDFLNVANNPITSGDYGFFRKNVSQILFFLFSHCSTKRKFGDQFCGIFQKIRN